MATPRILHLHASFAPGGRQGRAVRLMNAWGPRARHVVVSADPDALGARAMIAPDVPHEIAQSPPPLAGKPSVARYEALARFLRGYDLVLTHGWGAIDGVMARRVFGGDAPPVIHHEDGFDGVEAGGPKPERSLYRRIALSAAYALVVPGPRLEALALKAWRQPAARVHRIDHGVDLGRYGGAPEPGAIPGWRPRRGEVVVGALSALHPANDLPALVRAVGGVSGRFRLVIAGEGPGRDAIVRAAAGMGMEDRLVLPGHLADPHRFLGHFDVLALSSPLAPSPTGVVEAMAAGLPVAALPVGDVRDMVSDENRPFVAPLPDPVYLRDSIQALVADPDLRRRVGAANRAKAVAERDEAGMIARYAALYEGALGRPGVLTG